MICYQSCERTMTNDSHEHIYHSRNAVEQCAVLRVPASDSTAMILWIWMISTCPRMLDRYSLFVWFFIEQRNRSRNNPMGLSATWAHAFMQNAENQRPKTIWLRYNRKPQVPNTIIHFHDGGADPAGAQLPRKARATAAMWTMATYHACITHCDDIVRRQVSDRTGHTAPVMYNAGNAAKAGRRSKRGRRVRVAWPNRPIRCGRWPKTFPPKTSDGTGQDTPNASKPVVWSQLWNNRSMPTQRSRKRTSGNELHGFARAAWE